MSRLHPFSRRYCIVWMATLACGLLVLPHQTYSQPSHKTTLDEPWQVGAVTGTAARPIGLADIEGWWSIHGTALSPDGQWFAHRTGPANGNDELIVRQIKGDKEYRFPTGAPGGATLLFSPDSKWMVFNVNAPRSAKEQTGDGGGKKTALLNLGSGKRVDFDNVSRVVFSGEAGTHLALFKNPTAAAAPAGAGKGGKGGKGKGQQPAAPAAPAAAASSGGDLVLYELATGNELSFGNVAEFAFDKKGLWLAMTIDSRDQSNNGIQLRNMTSAVLTSLDTGKADYKSISWNENGDGLLVLKGIDDKVHEGKLYSILGFSKFSSGVPEKLVYDPRTDPGFPVGMAINLGRTPSWIDDSSAIAFTISNLTKKDDKAPVKMEPAVDPAIKGGKGGGKKGGGKGATAGGDDKADLIIWHWADDRMQYVQQQKGALQDRNFSYLCVYRPADTKFVRLADDQLRQVTLAPKGGYAIALDTKPYLLMSTLNGQKFEDVYTIDLRNGARQKVLTKIRWYNGPSPDGKHLLYYEDGHYFTYELATGSCRNITLDTPTSFVNSEDDHNVLKPPTKTMGWSKDGASVLLSDNWDVWSVPVHGGSGFNLTSNGKKDAIRYRARLALNPEEKGIDLNAPVYFSMQGEWTKKSGIARVDLGKAGVTQLLWDDAEFGSVQKAKNADVVLYTRETNKDYPDYYATDSTFQNGKKLTNGLPNQDQFLWSSGARLIDYTSAKGDRLQGALFLPANYEKGKSYPTIVYIYEKLSSGLNKYQAPVANGFNKALYTSNGYAVLMPDIKFTVNDPGRSAVWCVLPALEAAVASGVVDKNRVGLHGHSWGGYETAFLVTQTDAFKAAIAGAPLTDMVSMYNAIFWSSGTAEMTMFESGQCRFSGGFWEELEAYIRNSPIHQARNVKTPLLLLHNDGDTNVNWTQGIEYFNTLRRLQKPVVMLQYKGENHGLAKSANKKDYTIRMREFFDHYLMDKAPPAWLVAGLPLRGKDGKE
jgi:dipeptidyl aminopeptidase/acylaminoacyl peptidase